MSPSALWPWPASMACRCSRRNPLAQALFKTVKVDTDIPVTLYLVVAELLASVFRMKGAGPLLNREVSR